MTAQVLGLSPKGSAWFLHHRRWVNGGSVVNWAFVFDYHKGLTAHEAWEKAKLPGCPPFYEVVTVQLQPFADGLSVNTKLPVKAQKALVKFMERVGRNVG